MKLQHKSNFTIIGNDLIFNKSLDPYEKIIYIYLVSRSNNDNDCFPSYKTIENDLNISHSKVVKSVARLKNEGFIKITKRKCKNEKQTSNIYTIVDKSVDNHSEGILENQSDVSKAPPVGIFKLQGSISDVHKQYSNNNIKYSSNNNHLSRVRERAIVEVNDQPLPLPLDKVLENAELYYLDLEQDRMLYTDAIIKMYTSKSITVNGEIIPQADVREKLEKLDYDIIGEVWNSMQYKNIVNKTAYLISTLYNILTEPVEEHAVF